MVAMTALRDALAARLATLPGVRAHATWPDQVHVPAAIVTLREWQYTQDLGRMLLAQFDVVLLAAPAGVSLTRAQDRLDALIGTGTGSVGAALEADGTLGGLAHAVMVRGGRAYGIITVNAQEYLGCHLDVDVWAT